MLAATRAVSLAAERMAEHQPREESGFLPVFQIHLRISGASSARRESRVSLRDARSRLIYARRLRPDYSTSAWLYLVINHRPARSRSPLRRARARARTRVMRRDAARSYADVYRTIIFTGGGSRSTHVPHVVERGRGRG